MKTVLTIDDSKLVRTMIASALGPWGCRVIEARNGLEGVAVARRVVPDLVLLDVLMPVLDGAQTLATLRQDPLCARVPVVMLTAVTGEQLVEECAHLGLSGYLVKPFTAVELERAVAPVLGSHAGFQTDALHTMPNALFPG